MAANSMFTVIGFITIGVSLGVLAFPAFALTAVTCSILYSFCSFDGTVIGFIADLLGAVAALQLGYFLTFLAIILYRRVQLARRNDK
jgi:hypothetical protein